MTHRTVFEWGQIPVGEQGFSRNEANALLRAAKAHPNGGSEGTSILEDHYRHLTAKQFVGVLAAEGCSLEILPKIDSGIVDKAAPTVRGHLMHMLEVVMDFNLSAGQLAPIARQTETLLEALIQLFAARLLSEVRRGIPRQYCAHDGDLPMLRGRLNVVRQFTVNVARPDRLATYYDSLEPDTPLMQIMKAAVVLLSRYCVKLSTQRSLTELRLMLSDVRDIKLQDLPWSRIKIDRSNCRWRSLIDLAGMFLRRNWQASHHDSDEASGITLLFPMNDLFEAYVTAQVRKALTGTKMTVTKQGGLKYCLGDWHVNKVCNGSVFQTKPDILIRNSNNHITSIIDAKWKMISRDGQDRKHGINQSDVYQMVTYARIYQCDTLALVFPSPPGQGNFVNSEFGIAGGKERLLIVAVDITSRAAVGSAIAEFLVGANITHAHYIDRDC